MTLSDEGLRALLAELEDDPAAQRRLRAGYAGTEDPLAMLRWRLDSGAADHPLREVPRLERIVHARAGTADERRRQGDSTRRLRELTERYRTDQGDLDDAIRRYLEPDVKPARPRRPWYRHPALWTAVAAAAVLGALGYDWAPRSVDSLTVFERPQTPQELDFAQGPVPFGADPASFRLVLDDDDRQLWVAQVDGARAQIPWDDGGICFYELRMTTQGGATGTCVPHAQFERAGIWMFEGGAEPRLLFGWGPTGTQVQIVRP